MNFHVLQQTVKGAIYSIKLKMEFTILNKLRELSHPHGALTFGDENDFVDLTKVDWNTTRQTRGLSNIRSQSQWVSDFEKSGIHRMESVYPLAESTWVNERTQGKRKTTVSDEVEEIQPATPSKVKGTATDLLYVDAVRRISG